MKFKSLRNLWWMSSIMLLWFCFTTQAQNIQFTSFDFPGAVNTQATAITPSGDIAGRYISADGVQHGFLLSGNKFTSIDVPNSSYTDATWINPRGQIVGGYNSVDGKLHGYLLSKGHFTSFDYPGAETTIGFGIGATGDIVGVWTSLPFTFHGFRLSQGSFSTIEFPGAMWTLPTMIVGQRIIGGYFDSTFTPHGFLLNHGKFQEITCPGHSNIFLSGLNPLGEMTGGFNSSDGVQHGLLVSNGQCIAVDFPGSMPGSNYANGINPRGDIVGRYATLDGVFHGYLRKKAQSSTAAKAEFAYSANLNQVTGFKVDLSSGALSVASTVPGPNDAGGMVADPLAKFLYVSDFTGNAIDGFAIDPATGGLTPIGGSPFPVASGNGPSGMAIDSAGKFLFLAHANLNSIFTFTRDVNTGALTSVPGSPFPAGTNPFHLAVHPSNTFLYASNYNDPTGSISAYSIDPTTGTLTEIGGSPFATQAGYPGPSRLAIEPLGKFLYVGLGGTVNANHFVAAFSIDPSTGVLTTVPGSPFATGNGPFSVAVDQSGKYLYTANSHDNTISAFTIDATTGALTSVSGSPFATGALGGFPFALAMDPAGMFLYTANQGSDNISGLSINATTGTLTSITGSPFAGVTNPFDLTIVKIP